MRHAGTTQPLRTHLPVVGIWERRLPGQHLPAHDALHASSRCALSGPRSVWRGVTACRHLAHPGPLQDRSTQQCSPCTRRRSHRGQRGAAMHTAPTHTPTHKAIHVAVHRGMLAPQHLGRQPAARDQPSQMGNTQHSSAMKSVQARHPCLRCRTCYAAQRTACARASRPGSRAHRGLVACTLLSTPLPSSSSSLLKLKSATWATARGDTKGLLGWE